MEKRKIIRRKPLNRKIQQADKGKEIEDQVKTLWEHPLIKGVAIIGTLYGTLFISKYIIKEYAEVVVASKKLRDAHRL
jgi:hypothetical protein